MSKQVQLEILDHLRPYLRAIYNVSPDTSRQIDFTTDEYSVARFMLNKCFYSSANDNDIVANFLISLRNFALNIAKYDAPLKLNSPVGVLTSSIKNGKLLNLDERDVGLLQQAIVDIYNEYLKTGKKVYSENASKDNLFNKIKFTLNEDLVNDILDKLDKLIQESPIFKNDLRCNDFILEVNKISASELGEIFIEYQFDIEEIQEPVDTNIVNSQLLTKLFNKIVKNMNLIASKCFEIPYLTYGNNENVRNLIDKIRTQDVEKDDLDIFFLFFSIIYNDGEKDVRISNVSDLQQLDSSKLISTRINLKKATIETYTPFPLIEIWLPVVTGNVYLNYNTLRGDKLAKDTHLDSVKEFFLNKYLGNKYVWDSELDKFENYGIGLSFGKSLETCLKPVLISEPSKIEKSVETDVKTKLLKFISGKTDEKSGSKEKYFGTVMFDNNTDKEAKILRASYNGWKYNKSTGKYEKFSESNGKMIEFDPNVNVDVFYASQCRALGDEEQLTCTQLMEKILMDDSSSSSIKSILNEANFSGSFASGRMRDIHPKLAKKILKNLGFKEVQFTTKVGTRVNLIEPYQNWLNRFVKTNKELKDLYETLVSESGEELRLFLKLLVKAVNDEKTMSTLSAKEKQEVKADYSTAEEEMRKLKELSEQYGVPIYTGKATVAPRLSLEQIKRGFGPEPDIYGPKFDSNLNLLNGYTDFNTASISPFLFLINSQFPGIKISEPYRFTNTRGSMTGGSCLDYDGAEIKVNTAFDLKSAQLKSTWKQLYDELYKSGVYLDANYVKNIDGLIDSLECGEASLLLNFSRIKKLSELIKADPSIVYDYEDGSDHIFTRDEIATIAQTFNKKMKEHIDRVNKGFDLLSNLKNRSVLGEIEIKDINV